MVKAYWDKIGCHFKENFSQENILFLENYVWISNFEEINIVNLKRENLTTEILLEDLSLGNLKNDSCILIPKNNLSCIRLNLRNIYNIFENEFSITNFKSLSSNTKIIIELFSMEDLAKLYKLKEYFPEHSELKIEYGPTIKN